MCVYLIKCKMQWIGFMFVAFVAAGMLALSVTLPLTTEAPHVPMPMMAFEGGAEAEHYQQQVCACKRDWALASDERTISNTYFAQDEPFAPDPLRHSSFAWLWGQFIDHDIVRSDTTGQPSYELQMTPDEAHITLVRAIARATPSGPECREPKMHETAWIDGSTIYGDYLSEPDLLSRLRDPADGCKLRMSEGPDGGLLTLDARAPGNFLSGDPRNTEHAALNAMHTLWSREHNRLCDYLKNVVTQTRGWTPEQRFWKARQIVVAKIQHITYAEWLPSLLGSQVDLLQGTRELGSAGRMVRPFAVSAYRAGHSMVANELGAFELRALFFNPSLIQTHGINVFLQGAYDTPALRMDSKIVPGLRDLLFATPHAMVGEDLVTRNLFRARELGMGTYPEIAQCYGQVPQNAFADPIHGLLSEPVVAGSSLPRTIAEIWAEQFRRLRKYDAHFYTKIIDSEIGSIFRSEILGTTLGRVIAQNTQGALHLPVHVFKLSE